MPYIVELYEEGKTWFYHSMRIEDGGNIRNTTTTLRREDAQRFSHKADAHRIAQDLMNLYPKRSLSPKYDGYKVAEVKEDKHEAH